MKKPYFLIGLLSVQFMFSQEENPPRRKQDIFQFEEKQNHGLPGFYGGSMVDGEVDGKPSVLITGMVNNKPTTELYQYDGSAFEKNSSSFTGVSGGQGIFLDIDKDGDQDIAIIGLGANQTRYFHIYENQGGGKFALKHNLTDYALSNSSIDAGDYNKDGYPDIIVTGQKTSNGNTRQTYLFDNKNDRFELKRNTSFTKVTEGTAKFIDLKGDGNLGVVLSGKKSNDSGTIEIYEQTNGTFQLKKDYEGDEYGYENVDIAVGNINAKEDMLADFIPVGHGYLGAGYIFYGDNSEDSFTPISTLPNFTGSPAKNTTVLKDFDKNGIFDFIVLNDSEDKKIRYYYNSQELTEVSGPSVNVNDGSIAALDFDNDGYLDLIVSGKDSYGRAETKVFVNKLKILSSNEVSVNKNISIYPNPTSESFQIQGIKNIFQVEVYEPSGRLIKNFAPSSKYNVSSLEKGIYIVVVRDNQGKKSTFKLLKK